MYADAMIRSLKALKLYGMAQSISDLTDQFSPTFNQSVSLINTLIKAEVAEREVRSINYQMKVARFPAHRDLAGFDFGQSCVSVSLVKTLHRCESWMNRKILSLSAVLVPVKHTWQPPSAFKPSNTIINEYGFCPPLNWSIRLKRKN